MNVAQLKAGERQQFVGWFDMHRHELTAEADDDFALSGGQRKRLA